MAEMKEPVVVDAVRTPVGRMGGMLKDWHPTDLLAHTLEALVERTGIDPGMLDDVIAGCVRQVGEQSMNIARSAALGAGFPEAVPGITIDRQCGSSQQAVHFAAQGIASGAYEAVIACGVESMTRVPLGEAFEGNKPGPYYGERAIERYDDGLVNQGISAELIAEKWGLSREELDEFSAESHHRADRATEEGRFEREIVSFSVNGDSHEVDQGIRPDTSLEALSQLKPAFKEDGKITAGNSSQISDGAAAVLLMERAKAESMGLQPRARILDQTTVGVDPVIMLTGPIPATRKLLERNGMTIGDIDLFEVNEAFAPVVLAWQRELEPEMERVNVNGGAMALGHPLGSTGARLLTTLLHELERSDKEIGLVTMCCGGGLGTGTLVQRM